MKNEKRIDTKPECVHCDECIPELLKDAGRTYVQLQNGQWSEEIVCDMWEIRCGLDGENKGFVYAPYEDLYPTTCPKERSLLEKIFQFFRFKKQGH